MTAQGCFITFEGVEGVGKSSIVHRLARDLEQIGHHVTSTREPGTSSIGPAVRAMLLTSPESPALDPHTEALLFAADRSQHVAEVISPALSRGNVVLCDRYLDSSLAYQGAARGLGVEEVRSLSSWATNGLIPHLTVLIDLDPAIGVARKSVAEYNRMEAEDLDFHRAVRAAFLTLAAADPDRYAVIDGAGTKDEVYDACLEAVLETLAAR